MPVKNCLPTLFYIICGYTSEHSFTSSISSNVSLCSMTFCYSRKLPSKVPFVTEKPTKIHSLKYHSKKLFFIKCDVICEDSMWLVRDFIGTTRTVHYFCRRTKLISCFFKKQENRKIILLFFLKQQNFIVSFEVAICSFCVTHMVCNSPELAIFRL